MESGYEKAPQDQGGLLEALHEQELQAHQGPKETQESEVFQGLQRALAAQDTRDLKEIQGPKARRDLRAHKAT